MVRENDSSEKIVQGIIMKSLEKLKAYLDEKFDEADKRLETNPEKWTAIWKIATILVPDKDVAIWEDRGFYPVNDKISSIFHRTWNRMDGDVSDSEEDRLEERGHREYFWNGTYGSLQKELSDPHTYEGTFVGETGEKKVFHYQLAPSRELVEKEKFLYQLAQVYSIDRPVIFSPLSRRCISIRLADDILPTTAKKFFSGVFDLQLEENDLAGKIVEHKELLWNLQIYPCDEDGTSEISPDLAVGAVQRGVRFYDVNEGTFIGYRGTGSSIEIAEKNKDSIHLLLKSNDAANELWAIDVNEAADPLHVLYFENTYEMPRFGEMRRLRSKGDIIRTLHRYEMKWAACSDDISLEKPEQGISVVPYIDEDTYGYAMTTEGKEYSLERKRYLPFCYIHFKLKDLFYKNYLYDYAQYVLSDLDYRFPDFNWHGVMDDV